MLLFVVCHLFILMIPLTPRSTLFPYTTLFRSHHHFDTSLFGPYHHLPVKVAVFVEIELIYLRRSADPARFLDRKSTRLNSSHSQISYAVFCLKKKITYVSFR